MNKNLSEAIGYILVSEGGFAKRVTEPGGAVNMGISMQTYQEWHAPNVMQISDLQAMTVEEATAIYASRYAGHVDFAQLPSGLDYCVLDAAVNEGIAAAIILWALAMESPPSDATGELYTTYDQAIANIAKINLTALKSQLLTIINTVSNSTVAQTAIVNALCDGRLAKKKSSPEWAQFSLGWTRRVEYVRANSLAMLGS